MRSIHSFRRPFPRLRFALAALLALAACDREITREEARADGPSLVRARSVAQFGPYDVVGMNDRGDIAYRDQTRWTREGRLEHVPMPYSAGEFRGINAAGVIAGESLLESKDTLATSSYSGVSLTRYSRSRVSAVATRSEPSLLVPKVGSGWLSAATVESIGLLAIVSFSSRAFGSRSG